MNQLGGTPQPSNSHNSEQLPLTFQAGQKLMRPGEFLSLCVTGTPFSLHAAETTLGLPGDPFEFLEVVWNAGQSRQLVHVHDVQMASEVWMQTQIKKRLCRKN